MPLQQCASWSDSETIIVSAQVVEQDLAFDRIFGVANRPGVTIGELVTAWQSQHAELGPSASSIAAPKWFEDLSDQLANAANSRLLAGPLIWMKGRSAVEEYAPMVMKVADLGAFTEMEVYFCERKPD